MRRRGRAGGTLSGVGRIGYVRFRKPLGTPADAALRADLPGDFHLLPKFRPAVTGDAFQESARFAGWFTCPDCIRGGINAAPIIAKQEGTNEHLAHAPSGTRQRLLDPRASRRGWRTGSAGRSSIHLRTRAARPSAQTSWLNPEQGALTSSATPCYSPFAAGPGAKCSWAASPVQYRWPR